MLGSRLLKRYGLQWIDMIHFRRMTQQDIGFAMGLGKIVVRTLTGVYEIVTAPFPAPSNFEPMIQPEFPWQYFDSEPGRLYGFSDEFLYEEKLALGKIPVRNEVVVGGFDCCAYRFARDDGFFADSIVARRQRSGIMTRSTSWKIPSSTVTLVRFRMSRMVII